MASTPARNISYPDPTTGYNPPVDWANTANSVENALVESANYGVGTTGEMNAAVSRFPDGAMWYNTTNDTEYRRVSGIWVAAESDTGWVGLSYSAGVSGSGEARKTGSVVYLRGVITRTTDIPNSGYTNLALLPVGMEPSSVVRLPTGTPASSSIRSITFQVLGSSREITAASVGSLLSNSVYLAGISWTVD